MNKFLLLIYICFSISVLRSQTVVIDISKSKLPNGIFIKKDYHFINGDTVYKKFEKYLTVVERGDSILYVENFDVNRSWIVSRYLVSNDQRFPAGWQVEYDINGYRLYDRYCDPENNDCRLYKKYNYYPNGNVMAVIAYYKHKLDGVSMFYYNDGTLKHCLEYVEGRLWNVNAYYDQNGNILDQGDFCNGTGMVNVYATNGKIIKTKWYKNGRLLKERRVKD